MTALCVQHHTGSDTASKSTMTKNSPSRSLTAAPTCAGITFSGRGGLSFMHQEEWRPVVGYEGRYEVSDAGNVRSIFGRKNRRKTPRSKSKRIHPDGYFYTDLKRGGVNKTFKIAKLVSAAFIGVRPAGFDISHLNGNRIDDRAENLVYESHKDNMKRCVEHGTDFRGEKNPGAKITNSQVVEIRRLASAGYTGKSLGVMFGLSIQQTCSIIRRRSFPHVP